MHLGCYVRDTIKSDFSSFFVLFFLFLLFTFSFRFASFNPIMQNTERDPSSPWKTPYGE